MPLSIWTSRILRSRLTFLPLHFLQRNFGSILSPWPWHSEHIVWICCIIPGPSCWIRTCIPVPRHVGQRWTAPALPPMPKTFFPWSRTTNNLVHANEEENANAFHFWLKRLYKRVVVNNTGLLCGQTWIRWKRSFSSQLTQLHELFWVYPLSLTWIIFCS